MDLGEGTFAWAGLEPGYRFHGDLLRDGCAVVVCIAS